MQRPEISSGQSEVLLESPQGSAMEGFEAMLNSFYLFTISAKLSILNVCVDHGFTSVTVTNAQKMKFSIKNIVHIAMRNWKD